MQSTQSNEYYTDKGNYAVMTRTTVVNHGQLAEIAVRFCRRREVLARSSDTSAIDNCEIAETMLGWTYDLPPVRIETEADC